MYLNGVLVGEEVDDFESVGDDSDGHELLAVVASLHHQATENRRNQIEGSLRLDQSVGQHRPIDETLHNGHLGLFELFFGITAGGVGQEHGMANLDIVLQRNVLHFDTMYDD